MLRMMRSVDEGTGKVPEMFQGLTIQEPGDGLLSFSKMLEHFYLNQCPPEPGGPDSFPPANLTERRQD